MQAASSFHFRTYANAFVIFALLAGAVYFLNVSNTTADLGKSASGIETPLEVLIKARDLRSELQNEAAMGKFFPKNPRVHIANVSNDNRTPFRMFVHDPKDCAYMSKPLYFKHNFEGNFLTQLHEAMLTLSPDEYFVDIGANVRNY